MKSGYSSLKIFAIFLVCFNIALAIYSKPIIGVGDEIAYIQFSKVLLGEATGNYTQLSPLYSVIMAGFMLFFSPPGIFKLMVFFQYLLIGISAYLLYRIFRPLFNKNEPAIFVGVLFNISLSTIYYANIILSEILTVFILALSIYLLMSFHEKPSAHKGTLIGIFVGLLSLARYNAIPLAVTFLLLIMVSLIKKRLSFKHSVMLLSAFSVSFFVILNIWCFFNYQRNGFWGLFQGTPTGVPRNALVSSIRPETIVSEDNKPVLEIFLKTRKKFYEKEKPLLKGSLIQYDKFNMISELYSGYSIYSQAGPMLREYYGLPGDAPEFEVRKKLKGFFEEVAADNKAYITKMRFLSLFSGFRASATALPANYGNINTNILPKIIFQLYKVFFLGLSVLIFLSAFFFAGKTIMKFEKANFILITCYLIIFSFWGINFVFITVSDANRFKFPAEPIILGLFVYYVTEAIGWLKRKVSALRPSTA